MSIFAMKKIYLLLLSITVGTSYLYAQDSAFIHPNTNEKDWYPMFNNKLTNAIFPKGVWTIHKGVITASEDEALWSQKEYDDFVLDLEFMNADSTNSGVIVHASNIVEWIPHSVEIQIADDYSTKWANVVANWQCAAIFGHQAVTKRTVKKPGEWNHFTITCRGKIIWVVLNGELVNTCDMSKYTSSKTNPDGSSIPNWLTTPMAELPLHGHIGFQGKHAGAPIYFRNIKIKELK